jgi:hypothetical protein
MPRWPDAADVAFRQALRLLPLILIDAAIIDTPFSADDFRSCH